MRRRSTFSRRPAEVVAANEPEAETAAAESDPLQLPLAEPTLAIAAEDTAAIGAEPVAAEPPAMPAPPLDPAAELAEYRRRVLANGGDVEARRRLARLLVARGDLAQALEQYEAARVAAPEDPVLVLEHAETLVALKKFDPAERELRRLLKFQPNNGAAYLQLGIASLRRGLYAQAEQELQRATELLPGLANAFFYRGEALNQLSRLDEAMEMLQRTVQLDPGNARAYYMMGILYDKKNLPNEAATLYRKAREVGAR